MDADLKRQVLLNTYKPHPPYDLQKDSSGLRCFRHAWLAKYAPWLAYSAIPKGAFIFNTYTKYKNFNEESTKHKATTWHKHSLQDAIHFLAISHKPEKSITCQSDIALNRKIQQENRSKFAPILPPYYYVQHRVERSLTHATSKASFSSAQKPATKH